MKARRIDARPEDHRLPNEALDAFRRSDRETLHRALELRPWQPSPLETMVPEPPAWCRGTPWADCWRKSYNFRLGLIEQTRRPRQR